MARRHLFYKNQRLAALEPDVHLTIIVDAMAHHALDGPVLSRNIRWTKLTEKLVFKIPQHRERVLFWCLVQGYVLRAIYSACSPTLIRADTCSIDTGIKFTGT